MLTTAVREFRTDLGKYLSLVKRGEEVMITEHGKPVAKLIQPAPETDAWRERLPLLAAQGLILLPSKGPRKKPPKPIQVKGKPLSEIVIEDRR